ncbi:uncharacterized protein HMPREF1541_08410 [Cyphellophora europaea CBS 101466]|uniref:Xylanolytic transcriptional activator regulatory domain-containing protein n=1 Tax=Cyphellophora europaea (strain CBS 101466) TaxID=1220924 RepID=W2RNX5_CYPE1|nr:uncharacterized protein HMPREF1541_08410 [Cyphellophora europaea CBS 101466]ETN37419.1 hypothetical protein HMPREF1541_08410 [Cyphellophora europaea CBS 101466]
MASQPMAPEPPRPSRHLTEVEERLERAEGLLRTFLTEAQVNQMLAQGLPDGPLPSIPQGSFPDSMLNTAAQTTKTSRRRDSMSPSSADLERDGNFNSNFDRPVPSRSVTTEESGHEFEAVPFAADDDFEWDERESLWTLGDTRGRTASFDADPEIPKLTDGMATLTANDTNTGFLGSVSGASLLRLIASSSNGSSPSHPGFKSEHRGHQLSDIPDYASPGPALRAQPLLTRQFVDTLIDAYFLHYHPTFPILHEPTFRGHYRNLNNIPKGSWHVLANLVAALGSFVSSPCSDDTHMTLFNAVKSSLSIESLEAGSLGLVQAFAMAANYLQKRNRPNSGYNYGGLALRLAISLGLHKEVHGWQTTPLKKEIRRRVWWSLCVLDVGATVTYGRPLNWPRVGVDTPFPLNIRESDLLASSTDLPPEVNEATVYTYVTTQSSYHLRTMRIYDRLISMPVPTADELTSLDDDCIEGWRKSLPAHYRDEDLPLPSETFLGHSLGRWRYRVMRVVMYRPFLLRWAQNGFPPLDGSGPPLPNGTKFTDAENHATKRCLAAADECISCLFRFWTTATHTRLAAWYVLYFLLQAALIPIHCLRRSPTHADAPAWRTQVLTALNVITAMNNINPSAHKCRDIFYRLCGDSLPRPSPEEEAGRGAGGFSRSPPPQQQHHQQQQQQQQQAQQAQQQQQQQNVAGGQQYRFEIPMAVQEGMEEEMGEASGAADGGPTDPWMQEIDTAIDGYDVYVDRLTNGGIVGGEGLLSHWGGRGFAGGGGGGGSGGGGSEAGAGGMQGWGQGADMTSQDWDWGLML